VLIGDGRVERKRLSKEAFDVLRRAGTEPRWASPLAQGEAKCGEYWRNAPVEAPLHEPLIQREATR